jgi:hypothetical protein
MTVFVLVEGAFGCEGAEGTETSTPEAAELALAALPPVTDTPLPATADTAPAALAAAEATLEEIEFTSIAAPGLTPRIKRTTEADTTDTRCITHSHFQIPSVNYSESRLSCKRAGRPPGHVTGKSQGSARAPRAMRRPELATNRPLNSLSDGVEKKSPAAIRSEALLDCS